jgi:DNA mismatch repair protein MutL
MGKIKILPPQEAQKIAAGEVVERPANVIKELIENALDAGATDISLAIEDGGKKYIKIVDNGFGMSREDALICIQSHATSKLTSVDDLDTIATFGFRGEALASIASVSQMTITTKEPDTNQGWQFVIEAGTITTITEVGCNTGTSIEIRELFYNLPARRKFLKKRETEWRAIAHVFTTFALDNQACSFTASHDDRQLIYCPATSTLRDRIAQLFETTLAQNMIECSTEDTSMGMTVSGVLSRPTYHRYDREQLTVFINHRWIKNFKLSQAIVKGYAGILPPRRYPAACIFITIDPLMVDVNIHPRKEEVQFLHPRKVEIALELMTKRALEACAAKDLGVSQSPPRPTTYQNPTKNRPIPQSGWSFGSADIQNAQPFDNQASSSQPQAHILLPHKPQIGPHNQLANINQPVDNNQPTDNRQQANLSFSQTPEYEYQLIGQVHACYIVIESKQGMVLIDQHAAHERILYEEFAIRFENIAVTQLMFPQLISLSRADYGTIEPYLSFFAKHGILLEPFSPNQITVKALPVHLKNIAIEDLVKAAIGWINELSEVDETEFLKKMNDNVRSMMACKAAIKAGDILGNQQMHELIKKLHTTQNRTTCPHGRPTSWHVSVGEIEKKFKRTL